jgi:hypothetical protein
MMGRGGEFWATPGATTNIACPGAPVGDWVYAARRMAFDGQTLVLINDGGVEIARLTRG